MDAVFKNEKEKKVVNCVTRMKIRNRGDSIKVFIKILKEVSLREPDVAFKSLQNLSNVRANDEEEENIQNSYYNRMYPKETCLKIPRPLAPQPRDPAYCYKKDFLEKKKKLHPETNR